jgi:membrane fusion protein (multidrug efflux system)
MNSLSSDPKKRRHLMLLVGGPAALLMVGLCLFVLSGRNVETDNAYVKADKVSISAEVSGAVASVDVKDNTRVKAGQVLFTIDKQPFEIAVAAAQANLANVEADLESMKADYWQKEAELQGAEENVRYLQNEFSRYDKLAKSNAVAVARLDEARHLRDTAIQNRDALKQELASELAKIGGDADLPMEEHPRYMQAAAQLEKAQLDLSRVQVHAPADGIVSNVTLRPGAYVTTGVPLFSEVDDTHMWIEANFKETDLTHVRAGQMATVKVDAYPGHTWKAKVVSITPATGAEFSILPSQNSSGNWVKVVQRVMVRIELDKYDGAVPLAAGMSSDVSIDTGSNRMGRWFGASEATGETTGESTGS